MIRTGSLPIEGLRGRRVRNTLHLQPAPSSHLGLVFSDILYPSSAPLLYYARELLIAGGADVLAIDYDDGEEPQSARFLDEVESVYETAELYHPFDRLTVVGKTLGTLAAAHLVREGKLPEQTEIIWISPPTDAESLIETLKTCRHRSLVVAGGYQGVQPATGLMARAESSEDRARLQSLSDNNRITVQLYEAADDNLERSRFPLASVALLDAYLHLLADFLGLPVRA